MHHRSSPFIVLLTGVLATLALAGPAGATVVVSSEGGVGGTITFSGDAASDSIRVNYFTGMLGSCPGGQCDVIQAALLSSSSQPVPGPGCWWAAEGQVEVWPEWGVMCPDASRFAGDLGAGGDEIEFQNISYDEAVIHGGPGADWLEGTEIANEYPNRDVFYGDEGFDDLEGYTGDDELHGGDDADSYIAGGAGNDAVYGDGGDDVYMNGGEGDDYIDGGEGDDVFGFVRGMSYNGNLGADTIHGGPGYETVTYAAVNGQGISVTMDDLPNDGPPGEHDNIGGDIERVDGTSYDDVLIGSAQHNAFDGGGGNDLIDGGGGPDDLYGGSGDDRVIGGAGADRIYGDGATCELFVADCPGGNDTVEAADGEKDAVIDCGPLDDVVSADRVDVVPTTGWPNCERISWVGPLPPLVADRDGDGVADVQDRCPDQPGAGTADGCPVTPPRPTDLKVALTAPSQKLATALRRGLKVRVQSTLAGRATVTVRLSSALARALHVKQAAGVRTARVTASAGGATWTVKLTGLSSRVRRALGRRASVRLTATLTVRSDSGQRTSVVRAVRLKR